MINTATALIGTTPTFIVKNNNASCVIINSSNQVVYVGGKNLTTINGAALAPEESITFAIDPGSIYGLVASGTSVITLVEGATTYIPVSVGGGVATNVMVTNFPSTQNIAGTVSSIETTGLIPKIYDYIAYTSASTTDTYVYKSGGSGGTTKATLVVTWTDSTKSILASVARS